MGKIKVLLLSIHYPLAMKSYFEASLRARPDIDLVTTGPYTGSFIPWKYGMNLPEKYAIPPTIPLPFPPNVGHVSYDLVKVKLPEGWVPDLVLTIDAGINWAGKPQDGIVATVGTDAHCLNYDHARRISDKFFNMHHVYSQKGDIDLPYAFSSEFFYPMSDVEKDTDAVLIGMPYPQRIQWVDELRRHGVSVLFENGPIFDEYRELNNRAKIGLNWASMQDLNCRVFELMGMRLCPVINHVPDLDRLGFEDGRHYLGFHTLSDAVERVLWAKEHPEQAQMIADNAYQKANQDGHTYKNRVETILRECGLI